MTNNEAREQGYQAPMIKVLLAAGATAHQRAVMVTLAHRELDAIAALLDGGMPMTAPIAAALGRDEALARLLAAAPPEERQTAFGMAVINNQVAAVRRCLAAGADPNAFLPVHRHSTALHDAAGNGNLELLRLLVAHGGRLDVPDTLWDGIPLGWAIQGKQEEVIAFLRSLDAAESPA